MITGRSMLLAILCAAILLMGVFPAKAAPGDDILLNMMSNDMMTAARAIGRLRSGELSKYKDKFEKAKNNLIIIISTPSKDMNIRMGAADAIAYFELKKALPALKNAMRTEKNFAINMSYQNTIDRLEGRIKGDVYQEKPAYSGTPGYYGTPKTYGTPKH
jgi:hypothetical protein